MVVLKSKKISYLKQVGYYRLLNRDSNSIFEKFNCCYKIWDIWQKKWQVGWLETTKVIQVQDN